MATKLNKFTGKIDFQKDPKVKIDRTLKALTEYLNSYSEDEAAKIISDFNKAAGSQSKEELQQRQKFLEAYKERNKELSLISANIKRIREDLIDEQQNKGRIGKASWTSNTKALGAKTKEMSQKAKDLIKNPLDWLKKQIFGRLLGGIAGKVFKMLSRPIGMIVGGLFAAGKLGARLIGKGVKSAVLSGMKAGGWIFNKVKGIATAQWAKVAPTITKMATQIKDLGSHLIKKAKITGKPLATKLNKVSDFFSNIGAKLSGTTIGKKTIGAAKGIGSAAKSLGKRVTGIAKKIGPQNIKKSWSLIKDKVLSLGSKLASVLSKNKGVAGKTIAKRIPKALGSFASKFIPGVGWALLAYNVYEAAKKSSGALSFAVNLIDGVTGGLLGVAVGNDNLGEYVQNLVKGYDFKLNPEELDLPKDKDASALDAQIKEIESQNNNFRDPKEIKKLENNLKNNPNKKKIMEEYLRLRKEVQGGNISAEEASTSFKSFIKQQVGSSGDPMAIKGEGDSQGNGASQISEEDIANNPNIGVEQIRAPEVNMESVDTQMAQQVQTGLVTMEASMHLAAQTAAKVASSIGMRFASVAQSIQLKPSVHSGTVTVQG